MQTLKNKWYLIVIFALLLFSVNKCTQSCSRANKIVDLSTKLTTQDSIIVVYNDSIIELKHQIDILNNDKSNQEKTINMQQDAINKIADSKKNINVQIKK